MHHGHVEVATKGSIKGKTTAEASAAPFQPYFEAATQLPLQQSSRVERQSMEEAKAPGATSERIGVVSYGQVGFCPNLPVTPFRGGKRRRSCLGSLRLPAFQLPRFLVSFATT